MLCHTYLNAENHITIYICSCFIDIYAACTIHLGESKSPLSFPTRRISRPYAISRKAHIAPTNKQQYLSVFIGY